MDTATLRAFLFVAKTQSFSKAAQQLHITQPAVSKRVAALEAELNTRLFDRIGKKISLTQAGTALLPRAQHILDEMADSRRALTNLSGNISGLLSIGTSHHIGLHRLPQILRAFHTAHPEVELDLRFMDSEAVCATVAKGELELGIVTLPLEPVKNLVMTPIWDDPLGVIVAPHHPLAKSQRVRPESLARYPAVLPGHGTYTREILERAFAPLGIRIPGRMSTNYLETIKMLVTIGLGWSVLPLTMVSGSKLHVLKLQGVNLQRILGTVHHRARTLSNAAQALVELLLKEKQ
ncbi:MAG: LysR family transcriptional regulator [Gammaproteobacteria bacterium]|nr:LysR family transcriptional regulator [Gammaproteobacteria bacterium]